MGFRNWLCKFYQTEITDEAKTIAQKKSQIYVLTIQILFGIIIGISFTDYHKVLVPFNPNFETLMIVVAYVTVLVSLVGYSITISNRFHINFVRFLMDVFLLYLYYELVYSPLSGFKYFLEIFPWIFGIYVIWQLCEYLEWRNIKDNSYPKQKFLVTILGTMVFFGCFFAIAYFYNGTATVKTVDILNYSAVSLTEIYLLVAILILLLAFRVFIACIESKKWEIKVTK